ncbi:cyclin-dependent kinase-like 4 [Leptopilina heterotoma]|uniref:cyclin-dependent kinase-like 4 n=1 Tax=Leptopilina heterotoma TaxID=63436 RepID=UPI001CA81483|nr:cyclin-dependent kinase-like 4 [Leptopilina heterotoma]XP_043484248.1 cyclin-dependent kinase-like 4 [Leptopilina heterotoma]XP_043484254.1 cyclin-dependent kinase-like 4 [Leptopilina heterotoma]XP_043484263.1 cyclin-dependent kinase-like 4 [Leptopilina heterotoma]XP_043484273.1 cyclin-dependent kinase-like 4 [Leptopilina heterotoma]
MDKYENLEVVGEGSYGVVMKCRHKETGQIVAIKKFLETEEDIHVRKLAFREIRMLRRLRHENLVNLLEVFRRRKRFYLVFEYLDHTVLDELETVGGGLGPDVSKRHIFQVIRGLHFCHSNNIIHRDIKPENVLVSPNGVVKLCDFGFARFISQSNNESCTDYVATRWYRAPELLIGDNRYGKPVDVWAVGCLYAEMVTGDPMFPGESEIDQLHRITRILGALCGKHQNIIGKNATTRLLRRASVDESQFGNYASRSLRNVFPNWNSMAVDFITQCLRMDPEARPNCTNLLQHSLFQQDSFAEKFLVELQTNVAKEATMNHLLMKREEARRLSVLSVDEAPRVCRSGTGRWQMNLIKEPKLPLGNKLNAETKENTPSHENNFQKEHCYIGPVSVVPNTTTTTTTTKTTTYIKRLNQKDLIIPETKHFSLPALSIKTHAKPPGKRKKLELSNYII